MAIRWILAIFFIVIGIYLVLGTTLRHQAIRRLSFVGFVAIGIGSLLFEEYWQQLSEFLGISASSSLLTYLITFAFIFYVIANYKWKRIQEQRIATLTREITLLKTNG